STELVPALPRAFFFRRSNERRTCWPQLSTLPGHPIIARKETPAPATVYGRQESDESYEGVISREGDLRIVNCRDDIQWIVQRLTGGRWRNKSFHRTRASLIQRYGPLEMILALPEHHDGFVEAIPRCKFCGRIKTKHNGGT